MSVNYLKSARVGGLVHFLAYIRYIVYIDSMPHISNKKLEEKYFRKIYNQLISMLDTAGTSRRSDILLKEFLTETEKIMLAKRLAIICLLNEGVSKPYISQILLISPSTVDRISLTYEIGMYPYITNIVKKNSRTLWTIFEEMIHDSVSKKLGKRRFEWLKEIERRHNRKIFKSS